MQLPKCRPRRRRSCTRRLKITRAYTRTPSGAPICVAVAGLTFITGGFIFLQKLRLSPDGTFHAGRHREASGRRRRGGLPRSYTFTPRLEGCRPTPARLYAVPAAHQAVDRC
ncbi:MAG: hypothetical protein E5X61_39865, partial [Mesorhizobium sp.]